MNEVKFRAKVLRNRFNSDEFKIYVADVDTNIYKNIKGNKNKEFILVGNLPNLIPDVEYDILANVEINKNFGIQYKVKTIRRDKPIDYNSSKTFLEEILTTTQADTLLEVYPDIINRIIKNDLEGIDLSKTKGIKDKSFSIIKNKVVENFCLIELVDTFGGLIDINTMKKLYDTYTSVELIKKHLRSNPYKCLCKLSRIGFKTADSILLNLEEQNKLNPDKFKFKFDYDLKHSVQRMKSCLNYILEENENNGNTLMELKKARTECGKLVPQCIDLFVQVIKENDEDIYVNLENKTISKKGTYETELYIANFSKDMISSSNIWNINTELYREVEGISMTDEQLSTLDMVCNNNIGILTAPAGCVDCDTEYFNGSQWIKISDYKEGDKVLQYTSEGNSQLVYPSQYHKNKKEFLYHMTTKTKSVDQVLSENHNVVYLNSSKKPKLVKDYFYNIIENNKNNIHGFEGRFLTTFNYYGTGIDLSEFEIRLMCAVICDGNFSNKSGKNRCRINIKKDRKKERLELILNKLNISYEVRHDTEDYNCYFFNSPRMEKTFTPYWYQCNEEQFKIVCDEVLHWDGHINGSRRTFSTTIKESADFIQFAFSCCGNRSTINTRDRIGEDYIASGNIYTRKSKEYTVIISNNSTVSISSKKDKNEIIPYKTKDGYEYCFTVESSMLVLRRNNRIFITGNCGKSASVKSLINMLDDNNKTYILMTPTGASSKVLKDYTNRECGTVHRQLLYNPSNKDNAWGYNEYNKITEDVVIIDEFSMVDIFLLKHIIDAIDINKTKLLLVFDSYQLPSVSCGNVAQDLLSSGIIPTTILTNIFRYAEGGLMQVATNIRNSEPFLPSDFKGTKIFGTKKDFIFCELEQSKLLKQCLIIYNKLIKDNYDLQDIMVLTSQNKGDYGTKEINKAIQTLMQKGKDNKFVMRGDVKFYKDDKVIQVINNYKALTPTNEETNIFNGNTGTIVRVGYNEIDVEFDDCIISYTKEELNQIELGYCITVHKCLPKDTILFTNKGILQLNKINNNANIGEFKKYEGDIQVYNGNYLEKPSHFYNNGLAKCKEITTKKGFKIKATMEHGIDVLNIDGNIVRKNIEDISLNDYLVINKNSNIYGDRDFTDLKEIKDLDVRSKLYKLPTELNKYFSEFLGLMVGDGVITQHGIALGKRHIDVVERFNELVYNIFGYKGVVKKVNTSNMYKSEISSMCIKQMCNQIKEITPHNKTIPQMILETSKENQCAFLRGIFEDGTVNIKNNKFDHIEVCNKDYETSKLIHLMLSNMGIISSLKLCKSTKSGVAFLNWRIYIYKESARLFNKYIGFISEFKQKRLQLCEVDSCIKNCSNIVYPNISNKLKFMINKYNIKLTQNNKEIDNDIRKDRITNITLTSFLDNVNHLKDTEEYKYILFLLNYSFIDSIESITETETDTYCLTMPKTHKFVQNGFYGWNCQGSSAKQVIVITPKSHTFMLNSNLLYVAPTRAKERVYMLGNISTINSAIKKKENFNRDTWLQELLVNK